ncbi:hypothetical protein THOG05_230038 [Vibrio rotiferianus]|nr:hypothetical protein THOG05_230038 [Vibrio rotiferianus]
MACIFFFKAGDICLSTANVLVANGKADNTKTAVHIILNFIIHSVVLLLIEYKHDFHGLHNHEAFRNSS